MVKIKDKGLEGRMHVFGAIVLLSVAAYYLPFLTKYFWIVTLLLIVMGAYMMVYEDNDEKK